VIEIGPWEASKDGGEHRPSVTEASGQGVDAADAITRGLSPRSARRRGRPPH
jgi:hypothetical protein